MRLKLVVVVSFIAVAAHRAAADRVVLHSKDSVTIDGKTYTCDAPSSDGVNLAIGDRLTVGSHDLRCKSAGGGGGATKPPDLAVESRVDTGCINQLYQAVSGAPSAADAIRWADACRPFEIGKQCTITAQTPDDDCVGWVGRVVSGALSDRDTMRAQGSCKVMQATCPALPTAVESKVDGDCVNQLYQAFSGKPDARTILGWLESCRTHPVGACTIVGGTLDSQCVNNAYQMVSGSFSATDAGTTSRACRTLQLSCP